VIVELLVLLMLNLIFRSAEPSPVFNRTGHRSSVSSGANVNAANLSTPVPVSKKARVLYDYDAADGTELSLLADEVNAINWKLMGRNLQ